MGNNCGICSSARSDDGPPRWWRNRSEFAVSKAISRDSCFGLSADVELRDEHYTSRFIAFWEH